MQKKKEMELLIFSAEGIIVVDSAVKILATNLKLTAPFLILPTAKLYSATSFKIAKGVRERAKLRVASFQWRVSPRDTHRDIIKEALH